MEISVKNDLKDAIKGGNNEVRDVLRMLLSDVKNAEIKKGEKLSSAEILIIIKKNVKRRKDSIEQYTKGGRKDLADQENRELVILQKYMPEQMSEDEISNVVRTVIQKFGESSPTDFGKIIGLAMNETKGLADGAIVSRIVKEELNK